MSNKSKRRKSWQEKLADSKGLPKVAEITDKMSKRWGTGTVVIPAPKEVDEFMRKGHTIEPGKSKKPPRVKDFQKYLEKL